MHALIENNKIIELRNESFEGSQEIQITGEELHKITSGLDGFYTQAFYENGSVRIEKTFEIPVNEPIPEPEKERMSQEELDKKLLEISERMSSIAKALENTQYISDPVIKQKTLDYLTNKKNSLEAEHAILISQVLG